MGFTIKVLRESLTAIIGGCVLGVMGVGAAIVFGPTPEAIYAKALCPLQIPHWWVWAWGAIMLLLFATLSFVVLRKHPNASEQKVTDSRALEPKIEILTGDASPYNIIEISKRLHRGDFDK